MYFHLPIYVDAMAHASITNLATWDEGFIDSCPSSFGSKGAFRIKRAKPAQTKVLS
jgi:hypothetical protein